ncbi:MAG: ABC transporter ATP-binding protein [Chitinispirillia bacterium]|jgi:ABC-2 type transport system ATP-binding protein
MVSFSSVSKKFGSFTAVDNVSYSINRGEYFALLGPNGAGKTTLVRLMLGFSKPTSGSITINGIPASITQVRKNVGYLAENHRIPSYMTGWEYLKRSGELLGLSGSQLKKEIADLLEKTGMTQNKNKKAGSYSKGMIQRIGLAAAILNKPQLLILDEPITGLDPIGIREIRQILEDLRSRQMTVILNSHLLSEVEKICDTVAIISKGRILVKDSIENIIRDDETLEDVFVRFVKGGNN